MNRIHDSLTHAFRQRRPVFWYDASSEWKPVFESFQNVTTSTAPNDKTAARKERERLEKARKDCRVWERDVILHLAQKRFEIDLDDGVKLSYQGSNGAVALVLALTTATD